MREPHRSKRNTCLHQNDLENFNQIAREPIRVRRKKTKTITRLEAWDLSNVVAVLTFWLDSSPYDIPVNGDIYREKLATWMPPWNAVRLFYWTFRIPDSNVEDGTGNNRERRVSY